MPTKKKYKSSTKKQQSSYLLLDEPPLMILPQLAAQIGLNEAVILQQVNYWLRDKRIKQDRRYTFQDRFWIYNGYPDWQQQFPFWSQNTIYRTIRSLEKLGILLSRQIRSSDRRKWYSIDYDKLNSISSIWRDGRPQDEGLLTEISSESDSPPPKRVRKQRISKRVLDNYVEPEYEPTADELEWASVRSEIDE